MASLSEALTQFTAVRKTLDQRGAEVLAAWQDATAQHFERDYLQPLAEHSRAYAQSLEQIARLAAEIKAKVK